MEYWFMPESEDKEYINKCLDCQLYSAVHEKYNVSHFTKPRIVKDIQGDTVFEAVEALQYLNKEKNWIINPLDINNDINYELIKHIVKNKDQLPNIELCPIISIGYDDDGYRNIKMMKKAVASISYGVDYIYIVNNCEIEYTKIIEWLADFRDKGKYKTKIMIPEQSHYLFMSSFVKPCYDGVVHIKDILNNNL